MLWADRNWRLYGERARMRMPNRNGGAGDEDDAYECASGQKQLMDARKE